MGEAAPSDFRVRVAAERRDRMRTRLLAATLEVCSRSGGPGAVVIDDVIRAADVSRGAFYRHFSSLEAAVEALVSDLVAEAVQDARTAFPGVDDPLVGSAIGTQLLLYRATMDRPWAGFVSGTGLLLDAPPLLAILNGTIRRGMKSGAFKVDASSSAADALAGILLAGIRRLHTREGTATTYICELCKLSLQSLGVSKAAAARATQEANAQVRHAGPEHFSWWRSEHAAEKSSRKGA
jgi:AcrR family transcriptional regulator